MLNINVPPLSSDEIKGIKIAKQSHSRFVEEFDIEVAGDGKKTYSLAGHIEVAHPDGTSDQEVVAEGYISITPLKIDLTDYEAMHAFEKWIDNEKE